MARSEKARVILHDAYMQGYRDGQTALLEGGRQVPRRRIAKELLDTLEEGPKPAEWCLSISTRHSVSTATVRRAAKEVGVFTVKRGDCWLWVHPKQSPPALQGCKVDSQTPLFTDRPITTYTDDCAAA